MDEPSSEIACGVKDIFCARCARRKASASARAGRSPRLPA